MYNQFKGLEWNYYNIEHSDDLLSNHTSTKVTEDSVFTENAR